MGHFVETFPSLAEIPGLAHGFTLRVPGIEVQVDRDLALARLDEDHAAARHDLGLGAMPFIFGQQTHGADLAIVTASSRSPIPVVDGVITATPGVCLGVYVADCCAVYLVDPVARVIGLAHSGRKGTDLGIARIAIARMVAEFGCDPSRMVAQLSPCIRPPCYEVDFAAEIVRQCREAGVRQVVDSGVCTACQRERYYSYRAERGKTGRLLALLALTGPGVPEVQIDRG